MHPSRCASLHRPDVYLGSNVDNSSRLQKTGQCAADRAVAVRRSNCIAISIIQDLPRGMLRMTDMGHAVPTLYGHSCLFSGRITHVLWISHTQLGGRVPIRCLWRPGIANCLPYNCRLEAASRHGLETRKRKMASRDSRRLLRSDLGCGQLPAPAR